MIDEHAEDTIARPGEEFSTTDGDEPVRALDPHWDRTASAWPVKQHWTGLQRDFASGRRKKPVNHELRAFTEPDCRVLAQQQRQPGGWPGLDAITDID